jgi:hypothetical protein
VRALSIGHWHHFSYLVISTALLGFGAGGTFVAVGSKTLAKHYKRWLWSLATGFAVTVPAAFYISQMVPFDELQLIWDRRQILYLVAYYLFFFVPFFCAGGSIALAFTVFADRAPRLYFFNMTGSGLGAAGIVALMYGNAPEHLLLVISGVAFAAALILAFVLSRRWVAGTLLAMAMCLLVFNPTGPLALSINISQHKSLVWYRELPEAQLGGPRFSPLGRLDTVRAPTIRSFPGLSLKFAGTLPEQMLIIGDADGISAVNRFEDFSDLECYDYMTSSLAYHLASEPEVCIIGAGGGSDVAQALSLGAAKVTAVEMNAQIIDLVHNTFNEFASGLFRRADVEIIAAEGRSFLQTTPEWFDVISISVLDSFSASAAGLYALNESHLYTVEAVEQALLRLWPQGLLSITRVLKSPPRDSLKMLATITDALRRRGVAEPGNHIIMIRSWSTATVVVSPQPLSDSQVATARNFAGERSFDLVHVPGMEPSEVNRYHVLEEGPVYYNGAEQILSSEHERFLGDYAYNIRPATDDRPYFFDFFKWKSLPHMIRTLGRRWLPFSEWGYLVLVATLLQAALASGLLILLPLWIAKPIRTAEARKLPVLVYFLLLGLAYMFLEMGFIQKMTLLIGHPVFGVAVTLVGFLFFSGCGSLACGRLLSSGRPPRRMIPIAISIVVLLGIAEIALLRFGFEWLVSFSRPVRLMMALVITSPLAFFMGMPFPAGLKHLAARGQPLVPWAWGVNGFASVTGAVLGTLLAISAGFTVVAFIALGGYFLAALVSKRMCS